MKKKALIIKIACFTSAFAAVIAGFLIKEHMINARELESADAIDKLTISEFAESIEKMNIYLSENTASQSNASLYAKIMLEAALARSALGLTEFDCPSLFSFLKCISELYSQNIEGEIDAELFSIFHRYSERICDDALPHLLNNKDEFEDVISEIFSDTSLETALYEKGFSNLADTSVFSALGGSMAAIDEKEAIRIAKNHLGKNAYLSANLTEGEHPFYHVMGRNTEALISATNGIILQLLFDLPEEETSITHDEAEKNAKDFLSEAGMVKDTLVSLSETVDNGLYLFEYAPMRNGVLCLSERILVGVSSGSGRIALFDAVDYYRYKTKRITLPEKMLTAEEIMNIFSLSSPPELCKIERKTGIESICYRFKAGNDYKYISAATGKIIE